MLDFMLALSVATVMTSLFMFRFAAWKKPRLVALVFVIFMSVEWIAETYFIPEGVFGPSLVVLCFALSLPFLLGSYLCWRAERNSPGG